MDNMSSATLLNLPREILNLICSHLCPHCLGNTDPTWPEKLVHLRQTLVALCLVCKQWRSSAQSILFHEYHCAYTFTGELDDAGSDGPLLPFLKVIIQRPHLASQVKSLCLSPSQLARIHLEDAQSMLEEAAVAMGTTLSNAWALRVLDTPSEPSGWNSFLGSLLQGRDTVVTDRELRPQERQWLHTELVCMAIALLPRLAHVSLERDYLSLETNLVPSLQALGITTLPLQSLRLYCGHDSLALKFLQLASRLETLHIHQFSGVLPGDFPLPNLTTLRLIQGRCNEQDLGKLLAQCVNLETFFYESDWSRDEPVNLLRGNHHFRPTDAVGHLRRHCRTLRSLHLDFWTWAIDLDSEASVQPIASLEDFGALQHLFVQWAFLPACQPLPVQHSDSTAVSIMASERWARSLPRTIVSLHLAMNFGGDGPPNQDPELAGLADAVANGRFPFLKEVRCDANPHSTGFLKARYTALGVDFGCCSWTFERRFIMWESEFYPNYAIPLPDSDDDI